MIGRYANHLAHLVVKVAVMPLTLWLEADDPNERSKTVPPCHWCGRDAATLYHGLYVCDNHRNTDPQEVLLP